MRKILKELLLLFMCVALVITMPAIASASGSLDPQPSVGEGAEVGYDENTGAVQATTDVSILIAGAISIISQTEDCYIAVGDDLELDVDVEGLDPFSYEWEVSTDGGATWQPAPGATDSDKYQITDAQLNPNDADQPYIYRVTITDRQGHVTDTQIKVAVREDADEFTYRRILDRTDKVAVSAWMLTTTRLSAEPLDEDSLAYKELYSHLTPGNLPINAVDLSLYNDVQPENHFMGKQKVEFLVGSEYDGQTLKVFQLVDGSVKEYSATVVDGVLTIEADKLSQFMVEAPAEDARIITVTAGAGGSASPSGEITVADGGSHTIVFLPDEGYVVDEVLVDGKPVSVSGNSYKFTNVRDDHTLDVSFKQVVSTGETHEVTVTAGKNGSVSPAGTSSVVDGESFTVNISPDDGYAIGSVRVNGVVHEVIGDTFTLSAVTEDTDIVVSFVKDPNIPAYVKHTIKATAGEGGSISPAGNVSVSTGSDMYFYFVPDEGYVVDMICVDGMDVPDVDGSYHFVNVVGDHTISVTFKPGDAPEKEYVTITVIQSENGKISPAGKVKIPVGGSQTFHFTPDSEYWIQGIYVNGKFVARNNLSYTLRNLTEDATIRVKFGHIASIPTGDTPTGVFVLAWVLLALSGSAVFYLLFIMFLRKKEDEEENEAA
ncbi:MAG: hypothetical protein E7559_03275 [Ruminococcaceae bacterium]|nr:hypothetical protein [Oscillospiraceae bacterium]